MTRYFSFIFLFLSQFSFSQQFEINGKILNPNGAPLSSATVYMEKAMDSSLITYTVTDVDGSFQLSGETDAPEVELYVSYAGFKPYKRTLQITEQINLEPITMQSNNELDEVIVTATRAPITIKKDTLEFNAGSFDTRPDANLEELMEKLPGVEVDSEGNITVNGKPVSRILVNGEEFFGDDPLVATKNLPKDIIDKIQITNTKTENQEFTGEAGDNDNKTVNITIQEDKNTGFFARATAGGGTDERYELSTIGNYFKDDLRVSVLASSNNINSSGFSYDEVFGMMGRSVGRSVFGGGGGGITKAETAGLNFVNQWEELFGFHETEVSADYFFGRNDTERRSVVAREYILPDSRYFTNSEEESNFLNDSHRANAEFEVEIDTLTRLSVETSYNKNIGNSRSWRVAESLDEDRELINNIESSDIEQMESEDFSSEIDFTKRFGSRGAFLDLEFSNDLSEQVNDNFYYSESFFLEDGEEVVEIQDQYIDEDEKENSYSFQARQRSVLGEEFFLDLAYQFNYANSTNKRYVYQAEASEEEYDELNELLSSDFEALSRQHTPNIGLNYERDNWEIDSEVGVIFTELENRNYLQDGAFDNTYRNLYVEAEVEYEIERSKSFSVEYETDVEMPSIRQLQPVVDRTNPLNIVVGNPELEPTYRQSIDIDYRNFDFASRSGIFSWFNLSFTDRNIVSVTVVDENLVRTTSFTNVDGAMDANLGGFYSKRFEDGAREFRYRLGLRSSYIKNVGFTNEEKYTAKRYSVRPGVRLTYAIDELFDINLDYDPDYNSTTYNINPDRSEDFINHSIGLEVTTRWPENVIFGNDISYNYFGNVAPGFDNTALFWNMSLGYQFLGDDATLKVKVYDALDQNVDTRRTIGDDFIQDTSRLILTRYAMLSFTYKVSQFGGKRPDGYSE
jgi:hypothetical protein